MLLVCIFHEPPKKKQQHAGVFPRNSNTSVVYNAKKKWKKCRCILCNVLIKMLIINYCFTLSILCQNNHGNSINLIKINDLLLLGQIHHKSQHTNRYRIVQTKHSYQSLNFKATNIKEVNALAIYFTK